MKNFKVLLVTGILYLTALSCNKTVDHSTSDQVASDYQQGFPIQPVFELEWVKENPVITRGDPGTEGNKYGFEGGCAIKVNNAYHLFTTEMFGNPLWTRTKLGYWTSKDGIIWDRRSTLFESTGDFTGEDPRACLWSPMPTYDTENEQWILTYVAYNSKPNTGDAWYRNYNGKILMAVSQVKGFSGIGGPYKDASVLLQPGPASDKWEGLMGTDSFFPFPACNGWLAFYGSSPESVGLAEASALAGPWSRKTESNPVRRFIENPLVTRIRDGRYIALFDGCGKNRKIGYMISQDGINWSQEIFFDLEEQVTDKWWKLTRTPMGLIQESEDLFTVYFTAYNLDFYNIPDVWQTNDDSVFDGYFASIGMFRLKLVR